MSCHQQEQLQYKNKHLFQDGEQKNKQFVIISPSWWELKHALESNCLWTRKICSEDE